MKLNLEYGTGVIVLPGSVFPAHLPPDASYLHVLIAVCANPSLLADADTLYQTAAAQCRLPAELVKNAIAYWIGCGVLSETETTAQIPAPAAVTECPAAEAENPTDAGAAAPTEKKSPRAALPSYPTEEYSRILSETDGLRDTIDECARIAGKLFSEHETRQLVALYDSYALDCEYLLLLFMYCKNMLGKTAVSYVVRTGLGLYDDGVRTVEALEAHIAARERFRDFEFQIRRLLGLGERALTAKEKEYIETWSTTYAMPMEVITRAYEITVKNIEVPRMSYINKILSGWNENGIRTTEAVDAAEAEFEKKKNGTKNAAAPNDRPTQSPQAASYDIDTFLELAMNRSFEDTN
ncbi:MAG: DnaD domain protein [Ruminococcaceae bacterium]|nr:DnaD domain protein [Oscillospiraceae bacterium]